MIDELAEVQPQAPGDAGREGRAAGAAADSGPRGGASAPCGSGWPRRSTTCSPRGWLGIITQLEAAQRRPAGLRRQPRQARPRTVPDRDGEGRVAAARGRRGPARAAQPGRGAPVGERHPAQVLEDAKLPDALAEEAARWSAIGEVKAEVATTGDAGPLHPADRGHAAAHRAGGAGQRGQRRRLPGRAYPVLHGGRGDPGRGGRRPRLRPRTPHARTATAASAWRPCGSACATYQER